MNATFVTPTFRRDFERFAFLRESMERCGIDMPHLAIVNTEDLPQFRELPFRSNLTLLSTGDLLGTRMDRRRQVFGISRKDYRYWITGKGIHGWMAQQLMKLAAARLVTTDAMICLDSDTFFVDRVTALDFANKDGRVHLYETTDDLDVEMAEWYAHSLRFLGIKETGLVPRRFTHSPVPMHVGVVKDMQAFIEKTHGMHWMDAMERSERITEYATYGTYARHIDNCRRADPTRPALTHYVWWKQEANELGPEFPRQLAESGAKMVLVNSNIGLTVEQYRRFAADVWADRSTANGTVTA